MEIIERKIPVELQQELNKFILRYKEDGLSEQNTYLFYKFILKSYSLSRENRYSIRLLAQELQKHELKVSLLINIYYHSLNCIALSNGFEIYGKGFNIWTSQLTTTCIKITKN